ncbi:type II toxin-antitoxin system RelE/ParE family toxin [Candidatus Pacearchaeota archaeon]|nr:type II toxin-antitoxin system RelE/ParE family toxin [Candidatus Pacearchaeota archaeon]
MTYQTTLSNKSKKFLKNCDTELYQRLMQRIRELSNNPFPQDIKRVEGEKGKVFRVRVGKHRITYEVYTEKNEILIVKVGKRDDIYD